MPDPSPRKSKRVMEAMLQMRKIDIAALECAHSGA
jgi:predicted 3-demethylubiquinone-9 3-methyltransferase (glyoxalase superfamily)